MLMPHKIDKHLVAAGIYGQRMASALEQVDLRTVPPDRREPIKRLRADIRRILADIELARVGGDDHFTRRGPRQRETAPGEPSAEPSEHPD